MILWCVTDNWVSNMFVYNKHTHTYCKTCTLPEATCLLVTSKMNVKNTTVKSHRALLQYGFVFYASQEQNPAKEGPSPFQAAGQHSSPPLLHDPQWSSQSCRIHPWLSWLPPPCCAWGRPVPKLSGVCLSCLPVTFWNALYFTAGVLRCNIYFFFQIFLSITRNI